jgi:hypothetical protein
LTPRLIYDQPLRAQEEQAIANPSEETKERKTQQGCSFKARDSKLIETPQNLMASQ